MTIKQLEKLKENRCDKSIIKLLLDKDDNFINNIIKFIREFPYFMKYTDNIEFLINYLNTLNEKNKLDFFIIILVKRILKNSNNLSTSRQKELLSYFEKNDYDYIYSLFLSNPDYNLYSIDKIDNFINKVKKLGKLELVTNIYKYRNMKEIIDILDNYNIDECYSEDVAKKFNHEQAKKIISEYKKLCEIVKDNEENKNGLYQVFTELNKNSFINASREIELMKLYVNFPNELVIDLITNHTLLFYTNLDEQKYIINMLTTNNYDETIYQIIKLMIVNEFRKGYDIYNIEKIIKLYKENKKINFSKVILENSNLLFDELYDKFTELILDSSVVTISKLLDESKSVDDIYNIIKENKINKFNSNTKVLEFINNNNNNK